jgi:hypothetical protein
MRARMRRRAVTLVLALLAVAAPAAASAPPVGPLPRGPVKDVVVRPGATFVVSVQKGAQAGLVWRVARRYASTVVRQVGEGDTARTVWLRFRAARAGKTSIVLALTRGETAHAYRSATFRVTVR